MSVLSGRSSLPSRWIGKQEKENASLQLVFSFPLFIQTRTLAHGKVPSTLSLPTPQLILSRNTLTDRARIILKNYQSNQVDNQN